MSKKKTIKKGKNPLTTSELAEASGVRYGTIKYYSQIGILPFEQVGKRLRRYYSKKEALKRFNEIQRLKDKRLTIKEIIKHFKDKKK